jgi:hypothetical protein
MTAGSAEENQASRDGIVTNSDESGGRAEMERIREAGEWGRT